MNSVIIGWNPEENIKKWDAFALMVEKAFLAVKTDIFSTDKEHIHFAYTVDEIGELISDCSILLCPEELNGVSIGNGTIKKWKEMDSVPLRVLTVIRDTRKSGGKCRGLYDNDIFDAIFLSDFNIKTLLSLVHHSRTRAEAFSYYGLDMYQDNEHKKQSEEAAQKIDKKVDNSLDIKSDNNVSPETPDPEGGGTKRRRRRKRKKTALDTGDVSIEGVEETLKEEALREEAPEGENPKEEVPKGKPLPEDNKSTPEAVSETTETGESISKAVKGPEDKKAEDTRGASISPLNEADSPFLEEDKGVVGDMPLDVPKESVREIEPVKTETINTETVKAKPEEPLKTEAIREDPVKDRVHAGEGSFEGAGVLSEEEDISKQDLSEQEDVPLYGEADFTDAFSATDEEIYRYLEECEELSTSYIKPEKVLTKTDRIVEDLLNYYTVDNPSWLNNLQDGTATRQEFEAELWQRIGMYSDDLNAEEASRIFNDFSRFMWGYDILEPYILDPDVQDIKIYEPQVIMVSSNGENMVAKDMFRSTLHYKNFVNRLATRNHVNIQKNAINRFTDTTSYDEARLRVNISTELINSNGLPLVHIRKVNNVKYNLLQLVNLGMATPRTFAYIISRIKEGASLLVCGENASGKTTILNTLIEFLPLTKPGLFIQESDEVFSFTHPLLQFQQIASDKEFMGDDTVGKKYTLAELAKNGLLTKIEFFGIGEMKGEETAYAHTAIDTGSQFMGTTHTSSSQAALMRLVRLAMMSEDMKAFTKEDLLRSFCQINLVIFMKDFQVLEVTEIVGYDDDTGVIYKEVPIEIPSKSERDSEHLKTYESGPVYEEGEFTENLPA